MFGAAGRLAKVVFISKLIQHIHTHPIPVPTSTAPTWVPISGPGWGPFQSPFVSISWSYLNMSNCPQVSSLDQIAFYNYINRHHHNHHHNCDHQRNMKVKLSSKELAFQGFEGKCERCPDHDRGGRAGGVLPGSHQDHRGQA